MIFDEDAVDHIPKSPPPCGRSHSCLMVLLLVLKIVQSGAHHTCGGCHA